MKREDELKSPIGQTALHYYQLWMRQQKRMPPPPGSFLASKYFRTFINFANFAKKVDLPRPDKFIWYMVEKKFQPTIWTNDEVYAMYMEFLDRKTTPVEQTTLSLTTLLKIADKHEVDIGDVFSVIEPHELIHLVRVRKLSPWLLLVSKKFKQKFRSELTAEQQIILESLIRPEYWADQMESRPDELAKVKTYVTEAEL